MHDLTSKVRHVLSVYLARGREALGHLEARRYDEAQRVLTKRNAAFHNFRAVDTAALSAGVDASLDPQVLALWSEIRICDQALALALETCRDETAQLVAKLRAARQRISSYRSGEPATRRFTQTA